MRLAPATARRVRAGRSGLNREDGKAADVIFTSVRPDGTATLSKPLPAALDAGDHAGATLLHEPFGPPQLADGAPNPRFERTLRGWLDYSTTIVRNARAILGDDAFDVEIWNEQTFGSDFLFQERYYDPPRERGKGDVTREILERTVRALRRESRSIGIGDGFASQTPFPSGATSPRGLTAIDKHPYYGVQPVPGIPEPEGESRPLDARGRRVERRVRAQLHGLLPRVHPHRHPDRDDGARPLADHHGGLRHPPWPPHASPRRRARRRCGSPRRTSTPRAPTPPDPDDPGGEPVAQLTPGDVQHLQAKAALRYYTAFVNKGVSAVHLFAVKGENLALVDPADPAGGETPRAIRRLTAALRPARAAASAPGRCRCSRSPTTTATSSSRATAASATRRSMTATSSRSSPSSSAAGATSRPST